MSAVFVCARVRVWHAFYYILFLYNFYLHRYFILLTILSLDFLHWIFVTVIYLFPVVYTEFLLFSRILSRERERMQIPRCEINYIYPSIFRAVRPFQFSLRPRTSCRTDTRPRLIKRLLPLSIDGRPCGSRLIFLWAVGHGTGVRQKCKQTGLR